MGALALAGVLWTQAPTPPPTLGPYSSYEEYGPPAPVQLDQIAAGDETHERTRVLTKGVLRPLGADLRYLLLTDETARVLVILVEGLAADDARRLFDRRIEVTGVVRALPPSQRTVVCRGQLMLDSKCTDPDLPVLPNAQIGWPSISLTVITLSDVGPAPAKAAEAEDGVLESLATRGAEMAGQDIRVVGRFAGRDLFGDLPKGSALTDVDWVLKSGRFAVWITGRKPQGKGWRLDPAYEGDTARWLDVTGRVEHVGGVTYVRASQVTLVKAPRAPDAVP